MLYFISLILHFEGLAQEAYWADPRVTSLRSSWDQSTQMTTIHTAGSMVVLAFVADIMLYTASTSLILASMTTEPPSIKQNYN
ncbi:hypothetical protein FGIG_06747 [Fasciola gigantica]|uniref:Uncharacterized protein n=1 Tax=Fasciola gigantica TaxID=46835 RepID=A0A504YQC9_FASGI|nr:hypothetical protein FGIG_06747 [Fasciola gigantica]